MKYGDRVLLKQFKNGNKLWGIVSHCPKCNDTGKVIWSYADHVCFDCNGKGWYYSEEREYTPENLAKLEAKKAKERAKWEAEEAEREAEYQRKKEEEARKEAERLAEIERNRGNFIGNPGDKIQIDVTLVKKFSYETHFGYRTMYVSGYVFKTDDGNTLVYKTTGNPLGYDYEVPQDSNSCNYTDEDGRKWDWMPMQEGERVTIKGTIKEHQEYNNVNQTILQMVKWVR